jgi:hypothetical protein
MESGRSFRCNTFTLEQAMSRVVAVSQSSAVPRTLVSVMAAALLALLALAILPSTSHAQLGGLTRKARAAVAGKSEKPAADQPARASSPTITTASMARFVDGLKAEQHFVDSARTDVKAQKAKYDANQQGAMQGWMDRSQKYAECTSEHEDKHPKQAARKKLQTDQGFARLRGETRKADSLGVMVQALHDQIEADAETACVKLKTTPEELQAQIVNAPQQPDEYGMMATAVDSSIKIGAQTAGQSTYQYGQTKEAVVSYLKDPKKSGISGAEAEAIEARRSELATLLKALGAM